MCDLAMLLKVGMDRPQRTFAAAAAQGQSLANKQQLWECLGVEEGQ